MNVRGDESNESVYETNKVDLEGTIYVCEIDMKMSDVYLGALLTC